MVLSKKAIRKLELVKLAILAEPELYNQSISPYCRPYCGSPCCLAGWLTWIDSPNPKTYARLVNTFIGEQQIENSLKVSLGEAYRLFALWPSQFQVRNDGSLRDAKIACRRIDHFIATDGQE